jgi:SOS-response transcriptional repressor LexA
MNHRTTLDSWVNYLFEEWLERRGQTKLHPSVEPLVKKLREYAPDPKHKDDAWHYIEQIEKLYDHVHRENFKVSARMILECGVAAYQMGNAHEAISFLTRSSSSFTDDHDKGVSCWLLGCVYWFVNNTVNALAQWEYALRHFRDQNTKNGRGLGLEVWYSDKIVEMEDAIKYAAEHELPPPPNRRTKKKKIGEQHSLQSLPVIGQIPAGFPLDVLPSPADTVDINRFYISGKEYCIVSLITGKKIVNLPQRAGYYYLLRVTGNSMSQSSPEAIEDGDYVLMREQHVANSGDIVAAVITKDQGENEQMATLKRYLMQGGSVFLKPESSDPQFQKPVYASRVFGAPDDEFQIRGIAIAVLKPV